MATYYLDYEGGSDAADGTSYANRWKTFASGATAARIAPGDTIRVMASPDPTSLGINATFTNGDPVVTLASALNVLITNCDAAPTGGDANVTRTADGTVFKTGTAAWKLAFGAGFTTGVAAYLDLGSNQDYSGYQGVTFWIRSDTAALASGKLELRLCSDAVGAVAVDTLAIPAISQTSQWVPVHIDKGSALGNAIRSISIYGAADPGTPTIYIDNISTTKAAGNDCLTLKSLIGKNSAGETFWPIREINGTTVRVDQGSSAPSAINGYYGTSETVAGYIRTGIFTDLAASGTIHAVQDSGTAGNQITFSGGWNRTDMSTQTGETWFDGSSCFCTGIGTNLKTYVKFDKLRTVRYGTGITIDGSNCELGDYASMSNNSGVNVTATNLTIGTLYSHSNSGSGVILTSAHNLSATTIYAHGNGDAVTEYGVQMALAAFANITTLKACGNFYAGLAGLSASATGSLWKIGTANLDDNGTAGLIANDCNGWRIDTLTCNNNGTYGWYAAYSLNDFYARSVTANSNGQHGIYLGTFPNGRIVIGNLSTTGNGTAAITAVTLLGSVYVLKSSMAEATKVNITGNAFSGGRICMHNYNGAADDHRIWYNSVAGGTIVSDSGADRHTAAGIAWKMSPLGTTYVDEARPLKLPLATFAVAANKQVTVKAWIKRDDTNLTMRLVCPGGQIDGVSSDAVTTASGGAGSYQEETLTFTPTAAGVVSIEAWAHGGSTYNGWVDDMTITQAA